MKKLLNNTLFLIILLAGALRLSFLSSVPTSLNWDEVSMGYSAYSVMKTGADEWGEKLPIFFRSYGEWKSAVYVYAIIPFIKVFGVNAWAVRLPSALAGVISVYLTYLIGKKIYSEKVGLWAALFLSVSPFALLMSRPAFEANVSLTLILAGTYLFLRYTLESRIYLLAFSAIALGLAPHTYNAAKVVVPFLVLYLVWRSQLLREIRKLILPGLILTIFAVPIAINIFSGVSQARLSMVGVTTDQKAVEEFYNIRRTLPFPDIVDKLVINKLTFTVYKVTDNWLTYLSPSFLLTSGGTHHQQSMPYHGLLYVAEFVLLLVGLTQLNKSKSPYAYVPLVLIGLGFVPAAITRDPGHVLRSILTLPGWQLLAGLGAASLANMKLSRWLIGLLAVQSLCFLFMYFSWYPHAYARDWQYGHRQVAEFLREHEGEYDRIVMTKWFGEPQLFLAFYNQWDPVWYQKENKQNLKYETEGRMWLDQLPEYYLGKYTFKYIEWDKEAQTNKTLYIGKFDDFPGDANILETITYPDSSVAFILATGTK